MALLASVLLGVGALLFWRASNQIYRHDDGTPRVMVQCASGFVLVVASVTIVGWDIL